MKNTKAPFHLFVQKEGHKAESSLCWTYVTKGAAAAA